MARRSAIFSCQRRMCIWSSIQKAHFSSVVRCSITATTCKKVASKSLIQTPSLIVHAAKVLPCERRTLLSLVCVALAAALLFCLYFSDNLLLHSLHALHHRLHHLLHFVQRVLHDDGHLC